MIMEALNLDCSKTTKTDLCGRLDFSVWTFITHLLPQVNYCRSMSSPVAPNGNGKNNRVVQRAPRRRTPGRDPIDQCQYVIQRVIDDQFDQLATEYGASRKRRRANDGDTKVPGQRRPKRPRRNAQSKTKTDYVVTGTFTVKIGFAGLCKLAWILAAVETTVAIVTQMCFEASKLLNLHYLRLIHTAKRKGKKPRFPDLTDATFIDRAFMLVSQLAPGTGGARKDTADLRALELTYRKHYAPERPAELPVPVTDALITSCYRSARVMMQTNALNHVTTNFRSRWRWYLLIAVEDAVPELTTRALRWKLVDRLYRQTTWADDTTVLALSSDQRRAAVGHWVFAGVFPDASDFVTFTHRPHNGKPETVALTDASRGWCARLVTSIRRRFRDLLPVTKMTLSTRWWQFAGWFHCMLEAAEDRNAREATSEAAKSAAADDGKERTSVCETKRKSFTKKNKGARKDRQRLRLARQFTLFPEHTAKAKYIDINSTALYALFKIHGQESLSPEERAQFQGTNAVAQTKFIAKKDYWWRRAFWIDCAQRSKPGKRRLPLNDDKRRFADSIRTDGVSCSVTMEHVVAAAPAVVPTAHGTTVAGVPLIMDPQRPEDYLGLANPSSCETGVAETLSTSASPSPALPLGSGAIAVPSPDHPPDRKHFVTHQHTASIKPRPQYLRKKRRKLRQQEEQRCSRAAAENDQGDPHADHHTEGAAVAASFSPVDLKQYTRVVGLDPGRTHLFVATDEDGVVSRCSTGEYRAKARFKDRARWTINSMRGFRDTRPDGTGRQLHEILLDTPTPRVSALEAYKIHLRYVLQHLPLMLGFYGRHKTRQWRWKAQIYRAKALDQVCRRVTGRQPATTLVGFGAAGFVGPGPVKAFKRRLRQHCRVVEVDEYLTSQICSRCQERELEGLPCSQPAPGTSRLYALRRCLNERCRLSSDSQRSVIWDRDVNAARNILHVFLYQNHHQGRRPTAFMRPPPKPDQIQDHNVVTQPSRTTGSPSQ